MAPRNDTRESVEAVARGFDVKATPALPSVRNPITLSATPAGHRPPPGLDARGEELRGWLAAPR